MYTKLVLPEGFNNCVNSILLNPGNKKYRFACPQSNLIVIVISPVEYNHAV